MKLNARGSVVAFLVCLALGLCPILAFEWKDGTGFRHADLALPKTGRTGFTSVAPETSGLTFTNRLAQDRHLTNQIFLNGSGVACGDVDGDGWCDLYFCGLDGPNALYRNLGNWRFQDITATAGVACPNLAATGAVFADVDGDGDLDLIVNSVGGGTHVFFNDGRGHFTESAAAAGMNANRGGMSLALADIDGDGDLDLYVANYRTVTLRDQPNTTFSFRIVNGQPEVTAINGRPLTDPEWTNRFAFRVLLGEKGGTFLHDENGEADVLYRNDGRGNFTALSWTDGTFRDEHGTPMDKPPLDWGLSVMFRDINGDGAPDIYVCNDFKSPDRIWMNDGKGHFRALAPLAIRQTSLSSMGVDFADINRDGHDDILVLDMLSREHGHRHTQRPDFKAELLPIGVSDNRPQYSRNTLFLNRGDGTYAEIAQVAGLEASEWSWTPIFLDVDLDGYEDLLVSNGFERDGMNVDVLKRLEALKAEKKLSTLEQLRLRKIFPRLDTANLAFHNLGNLRFEEASEAWGFHERGVSQGMAVADLDNDGDLDVVINNLNDVASVYRNETIAPRVAVRLQGVAPNTAGIGARINVAGGPVRQSQEVICGGRYLSGDDPVRVFAAGTVTNELRIEVTWRSGMVSVVKNVRPNLLYEIDEAAASKITNHQSPITNSVPRPSTLDSRPFFKDVSQLLGHRHHEEPYDDFGLQPLLGRRLSQLGPGVTWADLDGDGWEDLVIGSGRGGQLAAYRNDGHGGFSGLTGPPYNQAVTRDQTTILAWTRNGGAAGQMVLLAGSANYEDGLPVGSCVRQYELGKKTVEDTLPAQASSTGPLALADVDGDGQLDMFVGGRVVPGRYPEPASSLMMRGINGKFELDRENTKRLVKVGLVSGAVFSDLDGDGDPDLVLACEWGPLKLYRNEKGKLVPWDPPVVAEVERRGSSVEGLGPALGLRPSTLGQLTGWWNGVAVGDFDGDGRLDIVASNWGRNTPYEEYVRGELHIFYGDLAGRGVVDGVEAVWDARHNKLVPWRDLNVMSKVFPWLPQRFPTHAAYGSATLEEILGDRLQRTNELRANWLDTTVFLNRGDRFEARPLPSEAQFAPAFGVCAGDFDGDGREDIFLGQNFFAVNEQTSRYDAGRGLWLQGDGAGGFRAVGGQESGVLAYGEQRGAALGDYDADGRVDLVMAQNSAETKLYQNRRGRPGLRVRLKGPPANPAGIGAVVRVGPAERLGAAREVHAGAGYWSQDSAVQVMATPEPVSRIWVRWPGGATVMAEVPPAAKEISVDTAGKVQVLR